MKRVGRGMRVKEVKYRFLVFRTHLSPIWMADSLKKNHALMCRPLVPSPGLPACEYKPRPGKDPIIFVSSVPEPRPPRSAPHLTR